MKRQLLIFDLDGTLIDSRHDLCTGINLMRRHYNLPPLPVETVSGFIGEGIRNLVARSLEGHAINLDEAMRVNYRFYLEHLYDKTTLYAGVAEGLPALFNQGRVLTLISNKGKEACLKILAHFKIDKFFSFVSGGDCGRPLKPNPDTVFQTMRRAGINSDETWVIGDNHTDLAAARNAGVKSVFVTYGIGKPGGEKPSLTFEDFDSLVRYFFGANLEETFNFQH